MLFKFKGGLSPLFIILLCFKVGDSVVSKGRETLERCVRQIEGNEKWNARVVYGDTDSVFVLLKGRSKDEAFAIGINRMKNGVPGVAI